MPDSEHFDLTSPEGTKAAHDWAASRNQMAAAVASAAFAQAAGMGLIAGGAGAVGAIAGGAALGPAGLLYSAYKLIRRALSTGEAAHQQSEAAVEIIKAGREAGVKRMVVEIDNKAGVDIGSDIEGIPVRCMIGSQGKIRIEAEYA